MLRCEIAVDLPSTTAPGAWLRHALKWVALGSVEPVHEELSIDRLAVVAGLAVALENLGSLQLLAARARVHHRDGRVAEPKTNQEKASADLGSVLAALAPSSAADDYEALELELRFGQLAAPELDEASSSFVLELCGRIGRRVPRGQCEGRFIARALDLRFAPMPDERQAQWETRVEKLLEGTKDLHELRQWLDEVRGKLGEGFTHPWPELRCELGAVEREPHVGELEQFWRHAQRWTWPSFPGEFGLSFGPALQAVQERPGYAGQAAQVHQGDEDPGTGEASCGQGG